MPNPENIRPHKFKKGRSGNPSGRPPKLPELDELLSNALNKQVRGQTALEAILSALVKRASAGDMRAIEILLNRAYGKPVQSIISSQPIVRIIDESSDSTFDK